MAIPATAAMATACYGAPMANNETTPVQHTEGADCNGDGVIDAVNLDECAELYPS